MNDDKKKLLKSIIQMEKLKTNKSQEKYECQTY